MIKQVRLRGRFLTLSGAFRGILHSFQAHFRLFSVAFWGSFLVATSAQIDIVALHPDELQQVCLLPSFLQCFLPCMWIVYGL